MLAQVEVLEDVEGGRGDAGEVDLVRRVLSRPVARREDAHRQVDAVHVLVHVGEVGLELVIDAEGRRKGLISYSLNERQSELSFLTYCSTSCL